MLTPKDRSFEKTSLLVPLDLMSLLVDGWISIGEPSLARVLPLEFFG